MSGVRATLVLAGREVRRLVRQPLRIAGRRVAHRRAARCASGRGAARPIARRQRVNLARVYAFVHIEKTGGVTLNEALRRSFGIFHCDAEPWRGYTAMPFDADDYRRLRWIQPGLRSIAGHCVTHSGRGLVL